MKIAFIVEYLDVAGGSIRMATIVANELVRREGMQVDIICVQPSESYFPLNHKVGVVSLNKKKSKSLYQHYVRNVNRLRHILRRQKYDWVIDVCVNMSLFTIPASIGLSVKIISWEHINANTGRLRTNTARRMATRFARRIVVLTEDDRRTYERKFWAQNVIVIANPVTINANEPSSLKDCRFLAVGRLSFEKGLDMLLDSWAATRCRHEGWSLRIVGSGLLEQEYKKQIERLGIGDSVEMLPHTKDVERMYRDASVFVLSSRTEGLGLVLIEAAAMGLPAVSFDCEAGPRNIIEDGRTGILVSPENVTAMAAAMDEMATDEEKRVKMGSAALVHSRRFSLENIMSQWVDLLNNCQK
jgi:glycosyltransferase involved in cell wall biosynthesis